ncbi:hypothetical protein ABFA07_015663 [Porites harrisoni]
MEASVIDHVNKVFHVVTTNERFCRLPTLFQALRLSGEDAKVKDRHLGSRSKSRATMGTELCPQHCKMSNT